MTRESASRHGDAAQSNDWMESITARPRTGTPDERLAACRELHAALILPHPARLALQEAAEDETPELALAARQALAVHRLTRTVRSGEVVPGEGAALASVGYVVDREVVLHSEGWPFSARALGAAMTGAMLGAGLVLVLSAIQFILLTSRAEVSVLVLSIIALIALPAILAFAIPVRCVRASCPGWMRRRWSSEKRSDGATVMELIFTCDECRREYAAPLTFNFGGQGVDWQ